MRNLSEFAVADTPGTAGPEYAAAAAGGDYLQCRFVPISSSSPVPAASPAASPAAAAAAVSVSQAPPRGLRGTQGLLGTVVGGGGGGGGDAEGDGDAGVDVRRGMGVRRDAEGKGAGAAGGGGVESGTLRARARRGSMSVGGDSGGGLGVVRPGMRGPSPGGFHGRGRGEVTLGAGEADLER